MGVCLCVDAYAYVRCACSCTCACVRVRANVCMTGLRPACGRPTAGRTCRSEVIGGLGFYKGGMGVQALWEASSAIRKPGAKARLASSNSNSDAEVGAGFNWGLLCCIPKKPAFTSPEHGSVFTPDTTRPLTLVNVDRGGLKDQVGADSYSLDFPLSTRPPVATQHGGQRRRARL